MLQYFIKNRHSQMDLIKCSGTIHVVSEPNLTTLNEDCQRHIFYFLDLADIINLADTCKPLRAAVCLVFQRKIRNAKIDIGHWKGDSFGSLVWARIRYPDIFISTAMLGLKFLRIFGHLIVNLHINFNVIYHPDQYETLLKYLEYGSDSFIELSLQASVISPFPKHFPSIPFTSVKILQLEGNHFDREIPINTHFPNVQILKLGRNDYNPVSAVRMHVPSVRHLFFDCNKSCSQHEFETNDVLELLKLNPQLEKLDLQLIPYFGLTHWDPKIIHSIAEMFPKLKRLKLHVPYDLLCESNAILSTPIHFDHVEHFSFYVYCGDKHIRISFSKLKYLELTSEIISLTHHNVRDLIVKNNHLTSISIESDTLYFVESFFEFNNVLANIEEINIGLIDDVRWECVLRFLKLNRALRKFSMIGTTDLGSYFVDCITHTENLKPKVGKGTLQFMIERDCDGLLTKYAIRHLKWELSKNGKMKETSLMQLCTYAELPLTTAQENYDYCYRLTEMMIVNGRNYARAFHSKGRNIPAICDLY